MNKLDDLINKYKTVQKELPKDIEYITTSNNGTYSIRICLDIEKVVVNRNADYMFETVSIPIKQFKELYNQIGELFNEGDE